MATISQEELRRAGMSHIVSNLAKLCLDTMTLTSKLPEVPAGEFHHALAYDVVLNFRASEIIDPEMGEMFKAECRNFKIPVDEILRLDEARRASQK